MLKKANIDPKRIFVVGHMGAGKALLSEALAKKLNWEFIDANLAWSVILVEV